MKTHTIAYKRYLSGCIYVLAECVRMPTLSSVQSALATLCPSLQALGYKAVTPSRASVQELFSCALLSCSTPAVFYSSA